MATKLQSDKHLNDLSSLPFSSQLGFAASCCQRMLPNYSFFTKIANAGNSELINQAMNFIWHSFSENHTEKDASIKMFHSVTSQYDQLVEHPPIWASTADSFLRALIYTLEMLAKSENKDNATVVGKLSLDCIFEYVLSTASLLTLEPVRRRSDYYQWIYETPIYLSELSKQKSDIEVLQHSKKTNDEIMTELVKEAGYVGIHPEKRGF